MRVLIAGGAGFIGSHLCDRFLADGYDVVAIDNFLSGSESNIKHLANNPHFTLIKHDITLPLPEIGIFDVVLHFASPASPNPKSPVSYMAHPIETLMVNSVGTKNLLDLATMQKAQIIFASTSEVYGDPQIHPQSEKYLGNVSCNGPRSCYDEAKRFLEAIAFAYHRQYQTKIKVIRIFNTYGSRMRLDDGRFVPNLINSYLNDIPFEVYGNGKTTRSFGYIDDLIDGVVRVVGCEEMIGQVVNLGNPIEMTLAEAIKTFEKVIGKPLSKQEHLVPPDDPSRRNPDITKAKSMLSWEPSVDFVNGITKTLGFYKKS
ncbi:MAG: GDP-mannose 4,6-dehydratase [bacterium]